VALGIHDTNKFLSTIGDNHSCHATIRALLRVSLRCAQDYRRVNADNIYRHRQYTVAFTVLSCYSTSAPRYILGDFWRALHYRRTLLYALMTLLR